MIAKRQPRLSREQKTAILLGLVPLADRGSECQRALVRAGFSAFEPRQAFYRSFCAADDIETHEQISIELVREEIGQPFPERDGYRSPILDQLRADVARRYGASSYDELRKRPDVPHWDCYFVDPCERRLERSKTERAAEYRDRLNAIRAEERRRLMAETARHATGLSGGHTYDNDGRRRFLREAMSRHLTPFGFEFDRKRSSRTCPVFSKALTDGWYLAWSLNDARDLLGVRFNVPTQDHGWMRLKLHVRAEDKRGDLESGHFTQLLSVAFQALVPQFDAAYWEFFGLDEMEVFIKAHAFFYGLVADVIEESLRKGFLELAD
jgi:hypothetical protein